VISVHRSPSGDFQLYLITLQLQFKNIKTILKLTISVDITVVYPTDTDRKRQLDSILNSYTNGDVISLRKHIYDCTLEDVTYWQSK